jgi:ribosomal protein L37AE/L43A
MYQRRTEVDMLGKAKSKRNFGNSIYPAMKTGTNYYMCDLCDTKTPFEKIRRTGEGLYLCPKCHKIISSMSGGEDKDSVMRFLMGNVI